MKKSILKEKLIKSNLFSNDSSIRSLLNGTRFPSYSKAIRLEDTQGIPVEAWKDIKSFISESVSNYEIQNKPQEKEK